MAGLRHALFARLLPGYPPKEPWEFGAEFTDRFRRAAELKYRLMPYVYAQAALCSSEGYPMLRTLFFEYPEDLTSWLIEDEYFFGTDLLVAPLMEEAPGRDVYLPPGTWIDYQSGEAHEGARWHRIDAGEVPVVMLVRDGAAIPHARLAQSTSDVDWTEIELVVFAARSSAADGLICLPDQGTPRVLTLEREGDEFVVRHDPLRDRVRWNIRTSR